MSGRSYCYRCSRSTDMCCCADEYADAIRWDNEERAEAAREEAAYVASCHAHGLVPFSSRELEPDEARARLDELETARRDMARHGDDR